MCQTLTLRLQLILTNRTTASVRTSPHGTHKNVHACLCSRWDLKVSQTFTLDRKYPVQHCERLQHGIHMIMSGFKKKINLNYTEMFGSYRAVNKTRLRYTNQRAN
jgi:hypothetical protein